ncbi:MAG: MmgE/PrpD family protein, partial [Rhizobacter sp.]|nr:MmgE/PrpD family protein [Rhizobacter sp.]
MHDPERPTASLGAFVAERATRPLPAEVADKAACCLLDAMGLAVLARDERCVKAIGSLSTPLPASSVGAHVWTDGVYTVLSDAVAANAVSVHAQFHDDSDNASWTHPASLVTPVAVSLGESTDAPVADVLRAIAIGYDTIEWLGARERVARALIDRGIRTSPTLGTIGAAAAAAAILKLDAARATHAVAMASSMTGGVLEPVRAGSDEWRVQNAQAARGGLLAAQLAARGLAGAPQGLEGAKGLARALAGLTETPVEWQTAPRIEAILDICAKPWATLGDNMSVVTAARLIQQSGVAADDIQRIRVTVWRHYAEYPGTNYRGPFDQVGQALASMAFATAAMLVHGHLEYEISVDQRQDPRILRLVPLIEIVPDDDAGPYGATVQVELADGRTVLRDAADSPRSLLFHDRPTATNLL